MNKLFVIADMMMEMCMSICCMCMAFGAFISDMFSVSEKKLCTA